MSYEDFLEHGLPDSWLLGIEARNAVLARISLDLAAATDIPNAAAISLVE
jgi:hypothetical protein